MEITEKKLKELILSRYKSIREFTLEIDIPYTTLDSIFKRGIGNSSVSNVLKVCNALHISADALAEGRIEYTYDDNTSNVTNAFYEEIGEMNLSADEIKHLLFYVKSMRNPKFTYGNVIKEAREAKGFTIDQLAEAIGSSSEEIHAYEENDFFPINRLKELYDVLGVTYYDILGVRKMFSESYKKIVNLGLAPEEMEDLFKYAEFLKSKK